jgi:hypothetical protein
MVELKIKIYFISLDTVNDLLYKNYIASALF